MPCNGVESREVPVSNPGKYSSRQRGPVGRQPVKGELRGATVGKDSEEGQEGIVRPESISKAMGQASSIERRGASPQGATQ